MTLLQRFSDRLRACVSARGRAWSAQLRNDPPDWGRRVHALGVRSFVLVSGPPGRPAWPRRIGYHEVGGHEFVERDLLFPEEHVVLELRSGERELLDAHAPGTRALVARLRGAP